MSQAPAVPATALEAAGAVVTETSLQISDPDLPWSDYERLGQFLGQMNRACSWWVGDLVLIGEQIYGEQYAQIEDSLGLAPQTIANRASVARHIPPSRRRASLPFGVHAEVAYLEPRERDQWLDRAERERWTRARLRAEMRAVRGELSDPVSDLAVTGKSGEDREEHSESGVPAINGGFLGEPVPDPIHIPEIVWMTEAMRQTVEIAQSAESMPDDGPLGRDHIVGMLDRIAGHSPSKMGRWLGWMQAAVVAAGAATLEDMKRINMECSARVRAS